MTEILLSKPVAYWKAEIDLYERTTEKWMRRGRKILKRYKDVRTPREDAVTRFNVLWSNVQTRLPALYARDPKPEVERRFKDRDPVGRQASEVLERSLDYTIQHCNPFGRLMRQAILDWELPGRGTIWVRYVPHMHKVDPEQADDGNAAGLRDEEGEDHDSREAAGPPSPEVRQEGKQLTNDEEGELTERLGYEETILDYVYWEDFGHTWARTWDEVRAIWRRVYLTREEGVERFGKKFEQVPLDWSPKSLNESKIRIDQKKAVVYEIWDKQECKVLWVVKTFPDLLDEKDDPLGLTNYFPTPPPLFANLTAEELVPTPNFTFYQDQAMEIDELSTRIASIGKALKVAGIYDSAMPGIDRLLAEGTENQLVPVDGWAVAKEKGGLKGSIEWFPLEQVAEALGALREQRQLMIDDVYQITGLSDIVRGLSEPNETATAQQIKGQFAVLRISDAQSEVQRYCRDLLRICAEIIADYDLGTLKEISGVKLLTRAEKAALHAQIASAQQAMPMLPGGPAGLGSGPPPGPPPQGPQGGGSPGNAGGGMVPQGGSPGGPHPQPSPGTQNAPGIGTPPQGTPSPEILRLLKEPAWEDVGELLSNKVLREFRIDIETDSTIRTDEDADREARMQFMDTVAKMMQEVAGVPKPLIPAVGELVMFGIRGFKIARNLERVFEDAIDQLKDLPPPPDPEMIKAQMEQQTAQAVAQTRAQADIQIAQGKQAAETQNDAARNQMEAQRSERETALKAQHEAALKEAERRFEAEKAQYETDAKKQIADADNATKLQIAQMEHAHKERLEGMKQAHEAHITSLTQSHEAALADHKAKSEKEIEGLRGQQSLALEDTRGRHQREVTELKPAVEAKHKVEAEKAKDEPHIKAIEKLVDALKEAHKPRKVVRDEKGLIVGIH